MGKKNRQQDVTGVRVLLVYKQKSRSENIDEYSQGLHSGTLRCALSKVLHKYLFIIII